MKVLIVEDDEYFADILKIKLTKHNLLVTIVSDGSKAIPAVKKGGYDLVILDILLPHKNGLEILREMKEDLNLRLVPVIMSSNLSDKDNVEKALKLGAKDYLLKANHTLDQIVEKVDVILTARS